MNNAPEDSSNSGAIIKLHLYYIKQKTSRDFCLETAKGGNSRQMKNKALLTVKEFCSYLGIGQTKARELLAENADVFVVRIGNRLYAHKGKLDEWLLNQIGY